MRTILAVVLVLIYGCGRASTNAPAPTSMKAAQYLALGDSYTIGESVPASDRWPVQLAGMLKANGLDVGDPRIIARTGWTGDELSAGIDAAGVHEQYRLVTLLIGVNNQYRGRSVEEFRGQLKSLLARAVGFADGQAGRVIVVSIPDWGVTPFAEGQDRQRIGREIDAFNEVCRAEAKAIGATFIDITPGSRKAADDGSLVAGDGLHPSAKMYRQWAEAVLPAAEKALKNK